MGRDGGTQCAFVNQWAWRLTNLKPDNRRDSYHGFQLEQTLDTAQLWSFNKPPTFNQTTDASVSIHTNRPHRR